MVLVKGSKPYTDGNKTKYYIPGTEPEGWYLGQASKGKTCLYHKGNINKRFVIGEEIPEGWELGASDEWKEANSNGVKQMYKEHPERIPKGERNGMYGKEGLVGDLNPARRPEVRNKISESCKGRTAWNKGIPRTDEEKKHQSEVMKGKPRTEETVAKWRNTLVSNFKYNSSKDEDELYEFLTTYYEQVIRQYSDERYPFMCDFYIPEEDLFIELNRYYTHGTHPYNPDCTEDLEQVQVWKDKGYTNAVYVFTDLDVRKQALARKNNLNYIPIY